MRYSYYEPDGALFEEAMLPPPSFRPLEASPEELAEYGYPHRPLPLGPSGEIEEWERLVSIPRLAPEPFAVGEVNFTAEAVSNNHWAGNITTEGEFTLAEGEYVEPSFDDSVCKKSAAVTWAGLGGGPNAGPSSYLFQTGTAHSNGVNIGLSNHQPWWETYSPSTELAAQPFPQKGAPAAADQLRARVETEPGTVRFNVYDYDLEVAWSTNRKLEGKAASPATAEMIVERPKLKATGSYPELSKFGHLKFVANRAAQEEGFAHFLSSYPTTAIIMANGPNPLAQPTIPSAKSAGGFEVEWLRCE